MSKDDIEELGIIADWLEEHGQQEMSASLRRIATEDVWRHGSIVPLAIQQSGGVYRGKFALVNLDILITADPIEIPTNDVFRRFLPSEQIVTVNCIFESHGERVTFEKATP